MDYHGGQYADSNLSGSQESKIFEKRHEKHG